MGQGVLNKIDEAKKQIKEHDGAGAPNRTAKDFAVATQELTKIGKIVMGLQSRIGNCVHETERYVNDRILKYKKLQEELVVALEKRTLARSKANERTAYEVSDVPGFVQSIEILRIAKVSEVHIQPLLDAQTRVL